VDFFARQEHTRRTSRMLVGAFLLSFVICALASTVSPDGFAAILTPLSFAGMVLITLARRRVFETWAVPSGSFDPRPAPRAPPLG